MLSILRKRSKQLCVLVLTVSLCTVLVVVGNQSGSIYEGKAQIIDGIVHSNWKMLNRSQRNAFSEEDQQMTEIRINHTQPTAALPRILCWILCDPNDLDKRVQHVKNTWTKQCDISLFMSSQTNNSFPTIGLEVPEGRNHIGLKSKAAWTYIYVNYLQKADYFVKADPDTYVVVDNLKRYLSQRDPDQAEFFGHQLQLKLRGKVLLYNSGGPGQVLSREAVRRLVEQAFTEKEKDCMPDGEGEDWKTGLCLNKVGAKIVDTRDGEGKETFMIYPPETFVFGRFPSWYKSRDVNGALKGIESISDFPIGFHYLKPESMYVLHYIFHHLRGLSKEHMGEEEPIVSFIDHVPLQLI